MRRNYGCNRGEHHLDRRGFLANTTAGAIGIGALGSSLDNPTHANQLKTKQKKILQIFLQGGASQLESWDPKPGTRYGGPFQAIPTSVPGMHISELLPHTAQRMHLLSIVRSLNIKINDHRQGMLFMEKGRRVGEYPYVGSVASKYLAPKESKLPGYIHITSRGINDQTAAFLGARHAQLKLDGVSPPANLNLPSSLTEASDTRREQLRLQFNQQFAPNRSRAKADVYDTSFQQAALLMAQKKLFEGQATPKDVERYGSHNFGRYCLLARDLLENGATCVKVTHHGYDSHAENFNFHLEQLFEFDQTFATLMDDLHERGLLEDTLVVVYSEFGRTPKINYRYGRDHWGTAWSVVMGGCGIQPGATVGSTNKEGTAVDDREVDAGHLFHTYLKAVGLDPNASHNLDGRSIPIADPAAHAIEELLA